MSVHQAPGWQASGGDPGSMARAHSGACWCHLCKAMGIQDLGDTWRVRREAQKLRDREDMEEMRVQRQPSNLRKCAIQLSVVITKYMNDSN